MDFLCIIPLLFSLLFAILAYRKNGFDLSFFLSVVYLVSSLCAIILHSDTHHRYFEDYNKFEISFVPTILYTTFMFFSIYPMYIYNSNKSRIIRTFVNLSYLNRILILYTLAFLIEILFWGSTIPDRLVLSNMKEYRDLSHSDETIMEGFSLPQKIIGYLAIGLGGGGFTLILFFYFCLAFSNKSKWYISFILLLSLLPVFNGLLSMDRSNSFYWILLFCLGFFLFKPYLKPKNKKTLYKLSFLALGILLIYFISVSIARFDDDDSGTLNALIDYAGQPYLIFCNEWNSLSIEGFSFSDIFPVLKLLPYKSTVHIINPRQISINGFHTYAGFFIYSFGHIGAVLIPIILFFIIFRFSKIRYSYLDIKKFTVLFLVYAIPMTGVISYFYGTEWRFIFAFVFIYWANKLRKGSWSLNNKLMRYD